MLSLALAAKVGRLLLTSRYPLPELDPFFLRVDVPPLSSSEFDRLLLRLGALAKLSREERCVLRMTVGGHPRLLEFVDALLRRGRASAHVEVTAKLSALATAERIQLRSSRRLPEAVAEALVLGARDILLEELLRLSSEEYELLLQAAVSSVPLDEEDLAAARWETLNAEH